MLEQKINKFKCFNNVNLSLLEQSLNLAKSLHYDFKLSKQQVCVVKFKKDKIQIILAVTPYEIRVVTAFSIDKNLCKLKQKEYERYFDIKKKIYMLNKHTGLPLFRDIDNKIKFYNDLEIQTIEVS